jgi:hypothetical protein
MNSWSRTALTWSTQAAPGVCVHKLGRRPHWVKWMRQMDHALGYEMLPKAFVRILAPIRRRATTAEFRCQELPAFGSPNVTPRPRNGESQSSSLPLPSHKRTANLRVPSVVSVLPRQSSLRIRKSSTVTCFRVSNRWTRRHHHRHVTKNC